MELNEMVEIAYKNYPVENLNRIWLTPQCAMNTIIEENGDNKFKIPHIKKNMLESYNHLSRSLELSL
jgi:hypothetical protein